MKGSVRPTVVLIAAGVAAAVLYFAVNGFAALFLGPEAFGNVRTVWGTVRLLLSLVEVGVSATLVRYIALYRGGGDDAAARYLVRRAFILRTLAVAAAVPVLLLSARPLAERLLGNRDLAVLFVPGALLFATASLDIVRPILNGMQRFGLLALTNVLVALAFAATGIPLSLALGSPGVILASALAFPLGTAPAVVALVRFLRRGAAAAAEPFRRVLLRYALPLHLASLPGLLVAETAPLLSLAFPQRAVGFYGFAAIVAGGVPLLAGTISQVLLPGVARDLGARDRDRAHRRFRRTLAGYLLASALGIVLTVTLGPWAIRTFAHTYAAGAGLFVALVSFAFLHGSLTLVSNYWIALGRLGRVAWLSALSSALWIGVSFALLYRFAPTL